MKEEIFDYVIIGSGFGGSVSAMRLTQKGYRVLILERGKRFEDHDFPKSNWNIWKYLWLPALRCFGDFEMTFMNGLLALHGSGVGGGSLMYANVLMEPDEGSFNAPAWKNLIDWKKELIPHYAEARKMLGVTRNPRLFYSDDRLKEVADDLGQGNSYQATDVGVFFGKPNQEGQTIPDPYFGGEGTRSIWMQLLRWLHGRLSLQCQEHTGQKLSVLCRKKGRSYSGGSQSQRYSPNNNFIRTK